jgi:PAS domain S-box-containing protein
MTQTVPLHEEAFDRLTRLAARLLGAPVAVASLLRDDAELVLSATGLPERRPSRGAAPLTPLSRHVVEQGEPLVIEDTRRHPLTRSSPAVRELAWIAYAGVPIAGRDGARLGVFAVADLMPRLWSERDVALLQDLAASVATEIALASGGGKGDFEASAVPMAELVAEGTLRRVNRAFADFLGHAPQDLLGRDLASLMHQGDRAAEQEAMRLLLAGECPSYTLEQRYLHASGEAVWGLATTTAFSGADGRPTRFLTAVQDITERKAVETALRSSEQRARFLSESSSELVRDWELGTDRLVWSGPAEALLGYAAAGLGASARWWYERVHADDRERVMEALNDAVARGERTWGTEYRFRGADGCYLPLRERVHLTFDDAGAPLRLTGVIAAAGAGGREQTQLYRSVVEQLREVVFQTDAEGRWGLLNPAWEELTGFAVTATLGSALADYVHPDDRADNMAQLEPLLAREREFSRYETRYLTRGESFRWVEVQARPTLDPAGAVIGVTGTLTDLTDRKRAEQLAAGQDRLLERIAAGVALPAVLEGIVRFTEENSTGLMGSVMLLEPGTDQLRLAAAPSLAPAFREAVSSIPLGTGVCGRAALEKEPVAVADVLEDPLTRDWREAALAQAIRSCWSVPILAADGSVLGTYAGYHGEARQPSTADLALADVAVHLAGVAIERERNVEALRQSTVLLEQVLDNLPVGVWVLDAQSRIALLNPASRAIWGSGHRVGMGGLGRYKGWRADTGQAIAAEEWAAARAVSQGAITLGEVVQIEAFDGAHKTILNSAVPIRGLGGEILGAIVLEQDVSEQRASEEALRRSEEQLRHAQKMEAVGQLAGGVAHDFNNLLTGILSYCDLLLEEVRQGDPIRADIEQIRHAGQRAAGLTRQLLAFSRRQVLQPKVLSLNTTVADLDAMLRRLLGADVSLEAELDPALWYVLADPGQVEQVLVNLAVNARDAMPGGGRLTITTANHQLSVGAAGRSNGVRPGDYVSLSVRDTGAGMDLSTQARIFEPFFTTKDSGKGTGLGLSTVYGIVEQSGGHIAVESAPGQGATFTIYLPRHEGPYAAAGQPDRRSLPGGQETLLLVEDESAVRSSARRLLERHGYTVLEARHGADALRIVEEGVTPIDLVLTDLVMPEMGGVEMVERLRARQPALKVLFMSGYTEKAITTEGVMPPRTGFVEKPFSVEQLMRRLREILDG